MTLRSGQAIRILLLASAMGPLAMATPSMAADADRLTVGIRADPTIDPHFLYLATNIAVGKHIYDSLIEQDPNGKLQPVLAVSWKSVDDKTWEFKLRQNVHFQDGSLFEPEDVRFSFDRVRSLPNNPNPYTPTLQSIAEVKIIDADTIHIVLSEPNNMIPTQLSNVAIVSHNAAKDATPADFTSGKAAIGTGPYKFASFTPGSNLELERFDGYWGEKPAYAHLSLRVMTNDASRVAGLLSGDVDAVDAVPPADMGPIGKNDAFEVFSRQSDRTIYLALNSVPDTSPYFMSKDGKELGKNPFKDMRVRKAVSEAIDREALVAIGLEGAGVATVQFTPPGFGGHNDAVTLEKPDPAAAKEMLNDAGYPDGFTAKMLCPNGRYVNDAVVCQLIAGMLKKIGIETNPDALPPAVFFSKVTAPNPQAAIVFLGWGLGTDSGMTVLQSALRTYDAEKGAGANNRGSSDPEVDRLTQIAAGTFDVEKRNAIIKEALDVARENMIAVPLYSELTVLAAKKDVVALPYTSQMTIIKQWHPVD